MKLAPTDVVTEVAQWHYERSPHGRVWLVCKARRDAEPPVESS
jgi:hypothetical protein